MKLVVFGLTISSSWGNGHATLWRGLCRALARRGHHVVFFERDMPYYAAHRDLTAWPSGELILYADWEAVSGVARRHLADADAAVVTSYCPDGPAASTLVCAAARPFKIFYDLDTPVTLEQLRAGTRVSYLPDEGLGAFDLVLSYTGGPALAELEWRLGARRVAPLYGHVDPEVHRPPVPAPPIVGDLSYLGTYAADRQAALDALFVEPARRAPHRRFVLGGAQYPDGFPWRANIWFVGHVAPGGHPAFFGSGRLTLNVTRHAMRSMGFCPSGRLFEAAACGVPIVSDDWAGLDEFYAPGGEILVARGTEQVLDALERSDAELARLAREARARTLAAHTADRRADELLCLMEGPVTHVGNHSSRRDGHAHPAARVLEGTPASGERLS